MALLEDHHVVVPIMSPVRAGADKQKAERGRMEAWLAERIDRAAREPFSEVVTLTPVLAGLLLERNEHNRPVSEVNLDRVKRDIAAGRWEFNGEAIIVSKDGKLNNGQHRCRAVVETGRSIPIVIVFGPARDTRMTLDQGVTRTVGHFLSMNGYHNANTLGAVAGYIWQYLERGRLSTSPNTRPTKSEALLVVSHYGDISDSIDFVSRNGVGTLCSKSLLAFCHWAIAHRIPKVDRVAADEFIDKIITGTDLQRRDPILYCRNRLLETKSSIRDPNDRAELIFRAWNAHRNNDRVDRISIIGRDLPKLEI